MLLLFSFRLICSDWGDIDELFAIDFSIEPLSRSVSPNIQDRNELHNAVIASNVKKAKALLVIPGNHVLLGQRDMYNNLPVDYCTTRKMRMFLNTASFYEKVIVDMDSSLKKNK